MTTKDYVYLGLLFLTALLFYCNGFYAGVNRCKRMYDYLLATVDDGTISGKETLGEVHHPRPLKQPVLRYDSSRSGESPFKNN